MIFTVTTAMTIIMKMITIVVIMTISTGTVRMTVTGKVTK